jgi:hypothetical protein
MLRGSWSRMNAHMRTYERGELQRESGGTAERPQASEQRPSARAATTAAEVNNGAPARPPRAVSGGRSLFGENSDTAQGILNEHDGRVLS